MAACSVPGASVSSSRISEQMEMKSNMWSELFKDQENLPPVAPVDNFKHAPFANKWLSSGKTGLVVEIPNPYSEKIVDGDVSKLKWWFAEVVSFAGSFLTGIWTCAKLLCYRAFVRFEKADGGEGDAKYGWLPFFSDIPRYIGYCAETDKELVPVEADLPKLDKKVIKEKQASLEGRATVSRDHYRNVWEELVAKAKPFEIGMLVEALCIEDCSQYRLAEVVLMAGDRVKVNYCGENESFWFSQHGSSIHDLGWCEAIGVSLEDLVKWELPRNIPVDIIANRNPIFPRAPMDMKIKEFMVFEMRHPVLPHKIVAGYVAKVLKRGYFIAGTDWTREDELVETILHVTSDYILPLNFCRHHDIAMEPPKDAVDQKGFVWENYLQTSTFAKSALDLSSVKRPSHKFIKGHKLEAVDIIKARHIRPSTVVMIAGHLLKIHFDCKEDKDKETKYQWVSCESSNIYPVGYAEIVHHRTIGQPEMITEFIEEMDEVFHEEC